MQPHQEPFALLNAYGQPDASYSAHFGHLSPTDVEESVTPGPFTPECTLMDRGLTTSAYDSLPQPPLKQSMIYSAATPLREDHTDPTIATIAGVSNLTFPTPPIFKESVNLRLPSFESLGIASPHPDNYFSNRGPSALPLGVPQLSQPSDQSHMHQTLGQSYSILSAPIGEVSPSTSSSNSPSSHSSIQQYIITHTPPDDRGATDWSVPMAEKSAGVGSDQPTASGRRAEDATLAGSRIAAEGSRGTLPSISVHLEPNALTPGSPTRAPWLCEALPVILNNIDKEGDSSGHLKILSHALPSPSSCGHAFPAVIDAIEQSTSPHSVVWINVWHAVSGRFSMEDLPKSPPSTPAPPNGGDDYFSTKVFSMAVEVPDYSERAKVQPLSQSPRPAISPSSIDVSIVERYIPPGNTVEFAELFSVMGRSFLSDRLVELSPNHGTLLFIYPTRIGGETFKKDYLGPILDPLLRELGTTYDLSINTLINIGAMAAADKLLSFEEMSLQLHDFLRGLSGDDATTPHGRFHRAGIDYSIVQESKQEVLLDRDVWARDWWNKQEKGKIQKAFQNHHIEQAALSVSKKLAASKASSHVATAERETREAAQSGNDLVLQRAKTENLMRAYEKVRGEKRPEDNEQLILELLQRVATRPYRGPPPSKGVEVGVFVIRKTMRRPTLVRTMETRPLVDGQTERGRVGLY